MPRSERLFRKSSLRSSSIQRPKRCPYRSYTASNIVLIGVKDPKEKDVTAFHLQLLYTPEICWIWRLVSASDFGPRNDAANDVEGPKQEGMLCSLCFVTCRNSLRRKKQSLPSRVFLFLRNNHSSKQTELPLSLQDLRAVARRMRE